MVAVDNLSLQLYTVRGKLEEDFDATLARIAEIGYTKVEPFGVDRPSRTAWPRRCPSTACRLPPRTPACSARTAARSTPRRSGSASPPSSTRTSTRRAGSRPTTSRPPPKR